MHNLFIYCFSSVLKLWLWLGGLCVLLWWRMDVARIEGGGGGRSTTTSPTRLFFFFGRARNSQLWLRKGSWKNNRIRWWKIKRKIKEKYKEKVHIDSDIFVTRQTATGGHFSQDDVKDQNTPFLCHNFCQATSK